MEDMSTAQAVETPAPRELNALEAMQVQAIVQELRSRQNFWFALVAGLVAALACAYIWALISVTVTFQIGWMAIGIGFVVGWVVLRTGKGVSPVFGYLGALLALFSVAAGNILIGAMVLSDEYAMPLSEVVGIFLGAPQIMVEILQIGFSPVDLLFYGIALYQGYRFSYNVIDEAGIAAAIASQSIS